MVRGQTENGNCLSSMNKNADIIRSASASFASQGLVEEHYYA